MSRQRAADLALGSDELVVSRSELDRLHDDLYMLSCALEDVQRDKEATKEPTVAELSSSLDWLISAAEPLSHREISAPGKPTTNTS